MIGVSGYTQVPLATIAELGDIGLQIAEGDN
jgi:hypothetical protein